MTYSDKVLALNPTAYYRLGETSGTTVTDSSGHGLSGTYTAVTLGAAGALTGDSDTAATFNGSSSYATLPEVLDPASGSFTIALWVKFTAISSVQQNVVHQADGGGGTGRALIYFNNQSLMTYFDGAPHTSTYTASAGTWHHFALVYDAAAQTYAFFVDGASAGSGASAAPSSSTGAWLLGVSKASANWFNGALDEVCVFSQALSSSQIATLADPSSPPPGTTELPAVTSSATSTVIDTTGMAPGDYGYAVHINDGEGWSPYSAEVTFKILPTISVSAAVGSGAMPAPSTAASVVAPAASGSGAMVAPAYTTPNVVPAPAAQGSGQMGTVERPWTIEQPVTSSTQSGQFDTTNLPLHAGSQGTFEFEVSTNDGEGWSPWSSVSNPVTVKAPLLRTATDSAPATDSVWSYNSQHYVCTASDTSSAVEVVSVQVTRIRAVSDLNSGWKPRPARSLVGPPVQPVFSDRVMATTTDQVEISLIFGRAGTDAASVIEALFRNILRPRTSGDSASATDLVSRSLQTSRSVTESLFADDAVARFILERRQVAETVALFDAAVRSFTGTRVASDVLVLSESASRVLTDTRTASDLISTSDSVAQATAHWRQSTDVAAALDASTRAITTPRSGSESSPTSETATRAFSGARTTAEALVLSEVTSPPVVTHLRGSSDLLTIADQAIRSQGAFARTIGDSALVRDDGTRVPSFFHRSVSETFTISDQIVRSGSFTRSSSEDAPGADSLDRVVTAFRSTDEAASVEDTVARLLKIVRAEQDLAPTGDVVQGPATHPRTSLDHLSTSDATSSRLVALREIVELLSTSDEAFPSKHFIESVHDSAPALDQASNIAALFRLSGDSVEVADSTARYIHAPRDLSEVAAAADTPHSFAVAFRLAQDALDPVGDIATAVTWLLRLYPQITITSVSRAKVSLRSGYETSVVTFAFDQPVDAWSVRVNSTSHLDGSLVEENSVDPTLYGIATIDSALLHEGQNEVTVYGRSLAGVWSP